MVLTRSATSGASPVRTVLIAAAIALGVLAGSACASDSGGSAVGSPSTTAPGPSASSATSRAGSDVGFLVPTGFRFAEAGSDSLAQSRHSGLLAAAPGAFVARRTWLLSVSGISGPVSRLAIAPDYAVPTDSARLDELLSRVAASPDGSQTFEVRTSRGTRVVRAHWGWIDTYAWVDPRGGAVWVLTENMDSHQGQWPGFIDALIAAQGA